MRISSNEAPQRHMTGTNLAAISQTRACSQHAASQMKGVLRSQVHGEEDEKVRVHEPPPLAVLSTVNEHSSL